MSISSKFRTTAAAAALAISAQSACPETPSLPEFGAAFAQSMEQEAAHRNALINLLSGLQDFARAFPSQQPEDMTPSVTEIQNLLNEYYATSQENIDNPALEADGVFGTATAKAIIEYAVRERDYNLIFESRFASIDMSALRVRLQELAPQEYIAAQSFINNEIISAVISESFLDCARTMQSAVPSDEKLEEEIAILRVNPESISSIVPYYCQNDLAMLPAVTRQELQINYLSSLFGRMPPEQEEWCTLREDTYFRSDCLEIKI